MCEPWGRWRPRGVRGSVARMAWDFSTEPEFAAQLDWMRTFVREEIIPVEQRIDPDAADIPAEDFQRLSAKSKKAGLWALGAPEQWGGGGLDTFSMAVLVEEMAQHRMGLYNTGCGVFGRNPPPAIWAGTKAQIEGLGRYFESLGLAFQMIDDVLNLKGFAGELKMRGEDIAHGKITLPVVNALGVLPTREARKELTEAILGKPQDQGDIDAIIRVVDETGGIDATARAAKDLVEAAWWAVEPLLEPSIVKLMLRSFGWFVLERHY